MHLTPDELLDLAEGARAEASTPHVQTCAACRRQIATLRAAMSAAAEVGVPEPSPLFWEHFSARVREAVAAEATESQGRESGWGRLLPWSWSTMAVAGVVAALALAIYLTAPREILAPSGASDTTAAEVALQPLGADDDPSLVLVADLAEQLDPDVIAETEWSQHAGAVDEVVANLTADERVELQRLLQEELAKS